MVQVYVILAACILLAVTNAKDKSQPEVVGRKELLRNLHSFISLVSGYHDNSKQVARDALNNGFDQHDLVTRLIKPVFISSLSDKYILFNQDVIGQSVNNFLWVLDEDSTGLIRIQTISVTSLGDHNPVDKNDVDYSDVTLGPLPTPGVCVTLVDRLDDDVYVGGIKVCQDGTDTALINLSLTATCGALSFKVGAAAFPIPPLTLPYILVKKYRFPLVPSMKNYSDPQSLSKCSRHVHS